MAADSGALSDQAPLRALVEGRWSAWSGLDPLPSADQVAAQLGPPLDASPVGGVFAGSPTMFRRYDTGDAGAVTVWFENDLAVAVQIDNAIRSVDDDPLPEPDLDLESGFGGRWRQHAFGSRGLVVHVLLDDEDPYRAALVLGMPPFTDDEYLSDPVRHLGGERRLP